VYVLEYIIESKQYNNKKDVLNAIAVAYPTLVHIF